MKQKNYRPRIMDKTVEEYLVTFGAVCLEGPKWCGKTWTSSYHSKSEIYLGDPAGNFQNRQLAELSPALVLQGESPRLMNGRRCRLSGMLCAMLWIRAPERGNLS